MTANKMTANIPICCLAALGAEASTKAGDSVMHWQTPLPFLTKTTLHIVPM